MTRTSRKQVEELCKLFDCKLVVHQMLGDRRDYWYLYTVIDSKGNKIADRTTLKDAYRKLAKMCREIVEKECQE